MFNISFIRGLFGLLIFFLTSSQAQWTTQSPVPTHLDIRGIGSPSDQHVFVATSDNPFDEKGSLYESTDGGLTWTARNIPLTLNNPFNGLFFLDSLNGWVYGNENYRTTDGGINWVELPFLGSTYFMKFYNQMFGLATGNFGRYISRNGGEFWEESPNGMFAFDFIDDLTGLGISDNGIYRTTDGGLTFNNVFNGTMDAIVMLSNSIAIGISNGFFIRSTDGGLTWTTGNSSNNRNNLSVVSENVVLAWGRSGVFPNYDDRVLRSDDGGVNWTDLGEIIPNGILDIITVSSQSVTASDLSGNMFHSTDSGLNWTEVFNSPGPQPGFLSSAVPVFSDSFTGYFGYGPGFIIKTTDSGISWEQISSGTGNSLTDADQFADGSSVASGENGTILLREGNSPWVMKHTFTNLDFAAVQTLDINNIIAVDENGSVHISTNRGTSWNVSTAPSTNFDAKDLHFTSLTNGWVAGNGPTDGSVFHTTDAGASWIPVQGFGGAYVAVDFEASSGWVLNTGGIFYQTTDDGLTWIQGQLPGSAFQVQDLDFFDVSIGYAVGWGGYAARSDDGGLNWEILPTPNNSDNFTDLFLLGANELWLSTNSNVAYYSATGGQNWSVIEIGSEGFGNFSSIIANIDGESWVIGDQGYIEYFAGPPPPPLNRPPDASFDFITNGLTVSFMDMSIDPDGEIVSWMWDFGDSTFSMTQNPSHQYDTANTYIVRLTVTDDDGAEGSAVRFIVVQPGPGGTFGDFTEVTPLDSLFITPQDEDFWVITTAPADFDNDGDLDIAVLGYYVVYNQSVVDKLVLIRNDGSAGPTEWEFTYIDVPLGDISTGASDLAWGDIDGDGDQDLIVGSDGETVIYINNNGTLTLSITDLPGYWEENDQADFDLRSISLADYDNDGDMDLLLPSVFDNNSFSFRTTLIRNDGPDGLGGIILTETDSLFAPTMHAQSAWADFDADQDLDLLLVNIAPLTDEGFIRRYRNEGGGLFTSENILGSLSVEHGEVQWGDYDGDGDLDILVAGNVREIDSTYTAMTLRIYRNDNENFVPFEVIDCIPCEGWFDLTAATWADYDSDGDMDILLAGTYNSGSQIEGRAKIYANNNGVFTDSGNELPAPRASGSRGGTFSWLDLDGDGDLDYFIAGQYFVPGGNGLVEAQMHVYRNDVQGQNNAPSTPTELSSTMITDNSVILSWEPSNDDHTPSAALTYDLELYRNNLPISIPERLPEPGNISAVNQWLLSNLDNGHYEWFIRAVDAAYLGSQIATGSFEIGILSTQQETQLPKEFELEQNYPNPFNPSTKINYQIPKMSRVVLKIFDITGRELKTLVDEIKSPGFYNIDFKAVDLPSGVYFYRIQADNFTRARKMVLLK